MIDERDSALKSQRMNSWLLGSLAALALSLAVVGVYGIVANSVVERTREFGIRMALGSSSKRIIWNAVTPGLLYIDCRHRYREDCWRQAVSGC